MYWMFLLQLKAFSCPKLVAQLHRIQQQLTESQTQTGRYITGVMPLNHNATQS